MNLEKYFCQEIQKYLKPGERFGIAVSGGVDSMTLLYLIEKYARRFSWKPVILHLNHRLRGRDAQKDAELVKRTAQAFQLPFEFENGDIRLLSRREKRSLEEAGRRARLDFFAQSAKRHRFKKILLAHHRDDLVETILMRLFRGTGPKGFYAMKETASLHGLQLIRPFLSVDKKSLQSFARRCRIRYREDVTNRDTQFFRNRVRLKIIPFLKRALGQDPFEKLLSFRSQLAIHQDFVEDRAQDLFKRHWKPVAKKEHRAFQVSKRCYAALHPAMQYGTLNKAYERLVGKTLEEKEWQKVQGVTQGKTPQVNLRQNSLFSVRKDCRSGVSFFEISKKKDIP